MPKEKAEKEGKGLVKEIRKGKVGTGEDSYQWTIACASHENLSSMPPMKGHLLSPGHHKVRSGNLW